MKRGVARPPKSVRDVLWALIYIYYHVCNLQLGGQISPSQTFAIPTRRRRQAKRSWPMGLRVSTRRTSVTGPKVVTRAAIARQSRSGGASNVTSIEPQPKKQRRRRQLKKKVEHVADEVVADEVLTPDWEARGARADQGRGPSQSRDVEVDQLDVPDRHDVQAVVPYPQAG